ncbi:hypothetical protein J4216_06330 [Candidatus Woesearchaeota archaeon]|nr:hypothetical protein [Candidatus Woesearchaeota archaeon]
MPIYEVYTTREFDEDFNKLDNSEKLRVRKIIMQLSLRGDEIGKPLSGLSFFREKKFEGKRLYFLVYKDIFIILAIAIGNKKVQQATINRILIDLSEYQQYVFNIFNKKD